MIASIQTNRTFFFCSPKPKENISNRHTVTTCYDCNSRNDYFLGKRSNFTGNVLHHENNDIREKKLLSRRDVPVRLKKENVVAKVCLKKY